MSENLYDLSILNEMVYGDTVFMKELVETFIEHAPADSKELADFAKVENWEETSKKAHKLKSSIRTIGVTSLSDIISRVEMDAKNRNNLEDINAKIEKFNNTLNLVVSQLKMETFESL